MVFVDGFLVGWLIFSSDLRSVYYDFIFKTAISTQMLETDKLVYKMHFQNEL